jgi:hypothetical protein
MELQAHPGLGSVCGISGGGLRSLGPRPLHPACLTSTLQDQGLSMRALVPSGVAHRLG